MEDLETLFSEQEQTQELIEKMHTNFKKLPKARLTLGYLKTKIQTLDEYWTSYRNTHTKIIRLTVKQERDKLSYFTTSVYYDCEDSYVNFKAEMTDMLEYTKVPSKESTSVQGSSPSSTEIKLPMINIPQFTGNYQEWTSFHDLYLSLIHDNKSLSNVQKMHYLKSSLSGEAEQLLKHIPISNANYEMAWTTLKGRYNNKRIIVNSILSQLINQRKIQTSNAKTIRELLDTTMECLNKLKNQEIDISTWDILIIHIVVAKLDAESHKEWEEEISTLDVSRLPALENLEKFLEKRFRVLEMIQPSTSRCQQQPQPQQIIRTRSFHTQDNNTNQQQCTYCKGEHRICHCKEFIKLEVEKRVEFIQSHRLCFNCLVSGHPVKYCKNKKSCARCGRKHHSLLHRIIPTTNNIPSTPNQDQEIPQQEIVSHLTMGTTTALMSTAVIIATNEAGQTFTLRALLDPCSQESFVTESVAQLMGLQKKHVSGHVSGVGQMKTSIKFATNIEIAPRLRPNEKTKITTYIVKRITNIMPTERVQITNWDYLRGLELADPTYYQPGHVDLLLGVDVYNEMILPGLIKGASGTPTALQTRLGWVLSGRVRVGEELNKTSNIISMHLNVELNNMLKKFWELETIEEEYTLTPEDKRAEEIYERTTTRDNDGRYVVNLPLRNEPPVLPHNSRAIAIKRWENTENRLNKNPQLKEKYNKVLEEYLTLNHMQKIENEDEINTVNCVYLPHHGVIKEDRETTPVRVVFDASCRGSNGVSLNDELLTGPSLLGELRDIILRWRTHKIVFVADVEKMYRQIRVCTSHTDLQRIVWRTDPEKPIEHFRLLTVTFGTSCAPYLAVKTLKQIAIDEASEHPELKRIIQEDFYMDDVLSGKDNEEEAIEVQKGLTKILEAGGFKLHKWCSNSEKFLEELEANKISEKQTKIEIKRRESLKALGLMWMIKEDKFLISNKIKNSKDDCITKRSVLSDIASLFDPMGWIAPTIVMAKIFMQKLWKCGLSWDEELNEKLKKEWIQFRDDLPALKDVSISRWIYTTQSKQAFELHGFADASATAYAAVIYARVIDEGGHIKISLLTSKTKVAPIKQVSLPRLELCAAVLLSKLLTHVAAALRVESKDVYAWSDSQVVLSWIHGEPKRWTPFVKNRVEQIVEKIDANHWYYVNTKQNPADPASRGVMPTKLLTLDIWWNGPEILKEKEVKLVKGNLVETTQEKRKAMIHTLATETEEDTNKEMLTLLQRFSSLSKLVRVLAYCKRWLQHLKRNRNKDLPTYLTHEERNDALTTCIRWSQELEFQEEFDDLKNKRSIKSKSRLLPLSPFLDEKGVIRVGGRLKHADMEFVRKHPIIISKDNILLPLLLLEAHKSTLHGGPQMMITYLRSNYWLINAGNSVKKFVRNCMTCAKLNVKTKEQKMGDLPERRVTPSRPFSISGVDFAGPINVRMSKGRGAKSNKAYICLFVCMATKAIHIELVSDMTTQAFLAAFRRFVSRRGHVYEIWSDNGTNFVGAEKELRKTVDDEGTKWRFIPPGAPNFGGLWEAGVKSTKYHLKRVIGESTLTFEELNTVLLQIEACLNSRPLSAISDHPDDLEPLTPGHLLIGEPLVVLPSEDYTISNINTLDRWKLTLRMVQDFWKRWKTDYLSKLQERSKWKKEQKEFEIGDLVIIKDQRFPPGRWPMGRILKKYPGRDGLSRTYDVRTSNGVLQRTITKLCALPSVTK